MTCQRNTYNTHNMPNTLLPSPPRNIDGILFVLSSILDPGRQGNLIPLLPASSIPKVIRPSMVDDVLSHQLPWDFNLGNVLSLAESSYCLSEELNLSKPNTNVSNFNLFCFLLFFI